MNTWTAMYIDQRNREPQEALFLRHNERRCDQCQHILRYDAGKLIPRYDNNGPTGEHAFYCAACLTARIDDDGAVANVKASPSDGIVTDDNYIMMLA